MAPRQHLGLVPYVAATILLMIVLVNLLPVFSEAFFSHIWMRVLIVGMFFVVVGILLSEERTDEDE